MLAQARAACDRLVVGLNSDASVKRLKGEGRPIQTEHARAEVLAALEAVDLVVVFEQDTPLELIRRVRPTVLVKGGDYRRDQVVGRDVVEAQGGEVILVDLVPGFSTTRIVERSRKRRGRVGKAVRPNGVAIILQDEEAARPRFLRRRKPAFSSRSAPTIRPKARRPGTSNRPAGPACWSSRSPISPRSW